MTPTNSFLGRFPCIGRVLPELKGQAGIVSVTLDVGLLSRLASAIAPDKMVTLFLPRPNADLTIDSPIVVVGLGEGRGIGVLMPRQSQRQQCKEFYEDIRAKMPQDGFTFEEEA